MLRIKNLAFEIDQVRSELYAYIPQEPPGQESPGHLRWSLEVYGVDRENEQDITAPSVYANEMTLEVGDWRLLEGAVIQDEGERKIAAYLSDGFINERTTDNLIRFSSRNGNLFTIEWQCLAHLFTLDGDSQPSPLQLNAEIAFNGVQLWWVKADAQGLATASALVGRHFDLASLQAPQIAGPYHIIFPPK